MDETLRKFNIRNLTVSLNKLDATGSYLFDELALPGGLVIYGNGKFRWVHLEVIIALQFAAAGPFFTGSSLKSSRYFCLWRRSTSARRVCGKSTTWRWTPPQKAFRWVDPAAPDAVGALKVSAFPDKVRQPDGRRADGGVPQLHARRGRQFRDRLRWRHRRTIQAGGDGGFIENHQRFDAVRYVFGDECQTGDPTDPHSATGNAALQLHTHSWENTRCAVIPDRRIKIIILLHLSVNAPASSFA